MRVGIDLLQIGELDRLTTRPWFRRFVFADTELHQAYALGARSREFLAGRFAAKEAVLKVLGLGLFQGVPPRDIALGRADSGEPTVTLHGAARQAARLRSITDVEVSITHKGQMVAAVAIGW
jgi:holo-[acyl-carrier protein] synthase